MLLKDLLPTHNISRLYADDLNLCQSLNELKAVVNDWIEFVPEAYNTIKYWNEEDFIKARGYISILIKGLHLAKDDNTDWCREVLFPSVIVFTQHFAQAGKVHEGFALFRLFQNGMIKNNGNKSAPRLYVSKLGYDFAVNNFHLKLLYIE